VVSREDRHTVPGTLTAPDGFIANVSKGFCGKRALLSLELLEASDIRFWFLQAKPGDFPGRLLMLLTLKLAILIFKEGTALCVICFPFLF
jgi:hypothetical protein